MRTFFCDLIHTFLYCLDSFLKSNVSSASSPGSVVNCGWFYPRTGLLHSVPLSENHHRFSVLFSVRFFTPFSDLSPDDVMFSTGAKSLQIVSHGSPWQVNVGISTQYSLVGDQIVSSTLLNLMSWWNLLKCSPLVTRAEC